MLKSLKFLVDLEVKPKIWLAFDYSEAWKEDYLVIRKEHLSSDTSKTL